MKKTVGERDERSACFGFAEWNIGPYGENIRDLVDNIIREGIEFASHEYKCSAYFPIEGDFGESPDDGYGGPLPSDPLTIYVELPIGPDEITSPRWRFTLTHIVDELIESCESENGGKISDPHVPSLKALRDGFRALADKIDARL